MNKSNGFAGLPFPERMSALKALDAIGAENSGYIDKGISVAVPRGRYSEVLAWAQERGFSLMKGGLNYFPLGTDKPAEILRHSGPSCYSKEGRGFWLFANFEVQS